jgi:hypothetical protein
VPVHPSAAGVQQDRPADHGGYRPVDGPADRGRQRDQDDLGALAAHSQDPVTVLEPADLRIHRQYSSRCGRCAVRCSREEPLKRAR